jgi:signal transduction histidine kinase
MDIQTEVSTELHKIHRSRNRIGYLPNIISLVISVYFQQEKLLFDNRWWFVIILAVVGSILRIVVNEIFFDEWRNSVKWVRSVNFFAFFCLALAWGLHFADVYHHYGPDSSNANYTLLVIVAFITGSSSSLLADKVAYYTFVLVTSLTVAGTYLSDPKLISFYIFLNIFIYLIFSLSNYRLSYRQLCELLTSKIQSHHEKEKLKDIIDTVPGFVGLIDKDLICYMANQATVALYPNLVGSKIGHIDPNSNWERFIIDFINSSKEMEISEEQTRFKDRDVYFILNAQRAEDGGAIIVSIVTTELVEAQKKIREQEGKAQYASKLASLGEMAAGIAHEVNNPLAIIQGSAHIVKRLVDANPIDIQTVKLLSEKMIETSDRISKTVRSLKALSRNGENDPKEIVSLNKVINQCMDISRQRCRINDIKLEYVEPMQDVLLKAREVQLSQVFLNLIGNAIDAVKNVDERWVRIMVSRDLDWVSIYIIDSGAGIPVEVQDKIMDPFFSTKDVNQGTGLGLSISKSIITDHGGELSLVKESRPTTFRIRFKKTDLVEDTASAPE